jgi:hypothetical protein
MPTVQSPTTVKPRGALPDQKAEFVDRRGSFQPDVRSKGMGRTIEKMSTR